MAEQILFVPFMAGSTNHSNGRKHWSKRHKESMRGHAMTKIAAQQQRLKASKGSVDLIFIPQVGRGQRRLDCSNYSHTAKIVEDGLVKGGYLPGDEPWFVSSVATVEPIRNRDQGSGMWVIIRPAGLTRAVHSMLSAMGVAA